MLSNYLHPPRTFRINANKSIKKHHMEKKKSSKSTVAFSHILFPWDITLRSSDVRIMVIMSVPLTTSVITNYAQNFLKAKRCAVMSGFILMHVYRLFTIIM